MENEKRLIEIPSDGIVCIPIMCGDATVGERRIDLSHLPTVDAVEVVHGRWALDDYGCYCSACGRFAADYDRTPYCSKCGAKMDGDGNG